MAWLLLLVGLILTIFDWFIEPLVRFAEPLLSLKPAIWLPVVFITWLLLADNRKDTH
ncbi:MAG: hypothetical protein RLZZ89_1477 [Cyanobacteriota bacterium]|jgi:hypothetical protein